MIGNLSHPRKRSVSVGPQSVADAYETLAYRNKKRRESLASADGEKPTSRLGAINESDSRGPKVEKSSLSPVESGPPGANLLPTPMQSRVHSYERMMGSPVSGGEGYQTPPSNGDEDFAGEEKRGRDSLEDDEENEDREIFLKIERPRVRYDVEVVTKLIVYSGMFSPFPHPHISLGYLTDDVMQASLG